MADLFFATYGELVLLTKAWKMHGSFSYIVVSILIKIKIFAPLLNKSMAPAFLGKLGLGCRDCPARDVLPNIPRAAFLIKYIALCGKLGLF